MANNNLKGALELNWINKDKSLRYRIDEVEGRGITPEWVEKDNISVSEPRNLKLIGEYGEPDNENMLIRGDNLLALKSLVEMFKNRDEKDRVKCIYIDPPFNTGAAFEHYDDNLEHSQWLTMMKDRLTLLKSLLREDGAIFVHIDDDEEAYLKILMDEIFGRKNWISTICIKSGSVSGPRMAHKEKRLPSIKQMILFYAKNKPLLKLNPLRIKTTWKEALSDWRGNIRYNLVIKKLSSNIEDWKVDSLANFAKENNVDLKDPQKFEDLFDRYNSIIFRREPNRSEIFKKSAKTDKILSVITPKGLKKLAYKGDEVALASEKSMIFPGDKKPTPFENLGDLWLDVAPNNVQNEGGPGISMPNGKKPEKLVERIIKLVCNDEVEIILDCFGGTGTTAAAAHKCEYPWILIEIGKHAEDFCLERLKRVIDKKAPDITGIGKEVGWKGGGGFRYYIVDESIISERDMNWNLTYEEIARALFMMFNYLFIGKFYDGIYIGRRKEKYALSIASKDIAIIKSKELKDIVTKVKETYTDVAELDIYTNKGIGVKGEDLPEGLTVKKIPESVLMKYKL